MSVEVENPKGSDDAWNEIFIHNIDEWIRAQKLIQVDLSEPEEINYSITTTATLTVIRNALLDSKNGVRWKFRENKNEQ